MNADTWRPACGRCGSTAISITTGACAGCGAEWDGTEAPEVVREDDEQPTEPLASRRPVERKQA